MCFLLLLIFVFWKENEMGNDNCCCASTCCSNNVLIVAASAGNCESNIVRTAATVAAGPSMAMAAQSALSIKDICFMHIKTRVYCLPVVATLHNYRRG